MNTQKDVDVVVFLKRLVDFDSITLELESYYTSSSSVLNTLDGIQKMYQLLNISWILEPLLLKPSTLNGIFSKSSSAMRKG